MVRITSMSPKLSSVNTSNFSFSNAINDDRNELLDSAATLSSRFHSLIMPRRYFWSTRECEYMDIPKAFWNPIVLRHVTDGEEREGGGVICCECVLRGCVSGCEGL